METLKAKRRTITGKKVKKLREASFLPAVIFGKNIKSTPITVDLKAFKDIYTEAGESTLVDVSLEEEAQKKVLITSVDVNPVTEQLLHASLYQVDLTEKITANVPIAVVGESPVVVCGEGIVLSLLSEVEVSCLPEDLPPEIPVDISKLEKIDAAIAVKDLPIDQSKIKINADPEELVLKIDYAKMEEEEEKPSEEELVSEVEVEKEKREEEGEEETKEEAP